MSRYVVVVNTEEKISQEKGDGDVVFSEPVGDRVVQVVEFEDEAEGGDFSVRLNGTVYRAQWAAEENARHRAAGGA